MDRKPTFGAALKALRISRGLSQQSFANVASREYISRLERGQSNPTLNLICQLADILQVHPVSLIVLALYDLDDGSALGDVSEQIRRDLQGPGLIGAPPGCG